MEEKNEKYLPLGTVCLLKGGERYIVVMGYLGVDNIESNDIYDYIGVAWPVGIISSDVNFMFNHDQIEKVIFRGYEDDESELFNNTIKALPKEEILKQMKENSLAQIIPEAAEAAVAETTNPTTTGTM